MFQARSSGEVRGGRSEDRGCVGGGRTFAWWRKAGEDDQSFELQGRQLREGGRQGRRFATDVVFGGM
jgi:hypothetical protein